MRKVLLLPIVALALNATPAHASEEGHPPTAKTTIDCDHLTVDPPAGTGVTFSGAINGVKYNVTAAPVPGTHNSRADISKLTTGTGTLTISATPDFTVLPNPYGVTSGPGVTVTVYLVCHKAPPTTTTTTTKESTSTTTTEPASTTTVPTPTTTTPMPHLPNTGSSPMPPLVGASAVGVGFVLALMRKRGRV